MNRRRADEGLLRPAWESGDWRIWCHPSVADGTAAFLSAVQRGPTAPAAEELAAGRNRVWRCGLEHPAAGDVVIKAFPVPSFFRRVLMRRKGSKAFRAFINALFLEKRDVDTPRALACVEHRPGGRPGAAWLITDYCPGAESFKRMLIRQFRVEPDCEKLMALLKTVARAVRRLHDAGFQHRDLGNQNIFLTTGSVLPDCPPDALPARVWFMDLNRGRCRPALTLAQRARDLSRLYLPSDLLRLFLVMYWLDQPVPTALVRAERRERRRYALHARTRSWRHPLRAWRTRPEAAEDRYPLPPDLWIWDRRSVQPIPVLNSRSRRRYADAARVLRPLTALIRRGPSLWRRYRLCRRAAFIGNLRPADGVFVAIDGGEAMFEAELRGLMELSARNVLMRVYHQDPPAVRTVALQSFDRLVASGFRVAVALVQDRAAVRDPVGWETFCRLVLDHLGGRACWIEYGHAVNRVKWGIWCFRELDRLARVAAALKRDDPEIDLVGPAVIDFEFDFAAAALEGLPAGFTWDALSLHLYVDRRGAPENAQGGFDALDKFALARALAGGHGVGSGRVVVSEFNWPLAGTGVWSPVGSPYVEPGPRRQDPSVDEIRQAQFLVRYLLLALCSGFVEACVVWRLAAHGFGLIDDRDGAWRPRPAFHAVRHLLRRLADARFEKALTPCRAPGVFALQFRDSNETPWIVAWSHPSPSPFVCPFPPVSAWDLTGHPITVSNGDPVGPSPVYLVGRTP